MSKETFIRIGAPKKEIPAEELADDLRAQLWETHGKIEVEVLEEVE